MAASPPVEVTLPAISAAVAIHIGHMGFPPRSKAAAGIAEDPGLKPLVKPAIFRETKVPR
jgi:hypothetical protein